MLPPPRHRPANLLCMDPIFKVLQQMATGEREEVENDEGRATAEYKCLKLMREQDSERDIGRLR